MTVTIKNEPILLHPVGSHWLELEKGPRRHGEPFSREELHPILEVDAPRLGLVRAQFEVNRYVHSSGWSEWRIILRDVRAPDSEHPDKPHLGRSVSGDGPATRAAISEACEPVILSWLSSSLYNESREQAAAYAVARELDAPRSYRLDDARKTLGMVASALREDDKSRIERALGHLAMADALLHPGESD